MDWALALSEEVEWTEGERVVVGDPNFKVSLVGNECMVVRGVTSPRM